VPYFRIFGVRIQVLEFARAYRAMARAMRSALSQCEAIRRTSRSMRDSGSGT
jgi:hypothetical protein